jgi:hypothetical protein
VSICECDGSWTIICAVDPTILCTDHEPSPCSSILGYLVTVNATVFDILGIASPIDKEILLIVMDIT